MRLSKDLASNIHSQLNAGTELNHTKALTKGLTASLRCQNNEHKATRESQDSWRNAQTTCGEKTFFVI
jgi:hypothetical protein